MKDTIKQLDGKEVGIEDYLTGKKEKQIIVRLADGKYYVPGDAWKDKPLSYDQFHSLVQANFINFNVYELDERPYRRHLFYKHFEDTLQEVIDDKHKVWRDMHR